MHRYLKKMCRNLENMFTSESRIEGMRAKWEETNFSFYSFLSSWDFFKICAKLLKYLKKIMNRMTFKKKLYNFFFFTTSFQFSTIYRLKCAWLSGLAVKPCWSGSVLRNPWRWPLPICCFKFCPCQQCQTLPFLMYNKELLEEFSVSLLN